MFFFFLLLLLLLLLFMVGLMVAVGRPERCVVIVVVVLGRRGDAAGGRSDHVRTLFFHGIPMPIGSMVLVYMLTWLGYIDGIYVTIYTIHGSYGMDYFAIMTSLCNVLLRRSPVGMIGMACSLPHAALWGPAVIRYEKWLMCLDGFGVCNVDPGLINPKRLFNWEGTI